MLERSALQVKAQYCLAQPRPNQAAAAARRLIVAASSQSPAAALQASDAVQARYDAHRKQLQQGPDPAGFQQRPHQLGHTIRSCSTLQQLSALQQQHGKGLSGDDVTSLLYKASMLAKSAKRLHAMSTAPAGAATRTPSNRSTNNSSKPFTQQDIQAVEELVGVCLQQLLEVNQQVTGQHLSNCLLSLAVLCSRGGPAAAAFSGAKQRPAGDTTGLLSQQQQQSQHAGTMLQQLITPPSSRGLEQLLTAIAPQHQLQQLLDLTCSDSRGCLGQAEFHQLVNTLYGLAVLPLRPGPHVLQQLLHHTQQHMQQLAAAAVAPQQQYRCRTPKLLSQLLWAVATLQIQPPAKWLEAYWSCSAHFLRGFTAQDVANTAWAAATLRLRPPQAWLSGFMAQCQAVSGSLTGQGLANTLWGLAVVDPAAVEADLLLQMMNRSVKAAKRGNIDGQNLANICWATAKCSVAKDPKQHQQVLQQLQQLLAASVAILPSLQPRDWSNILLACGHLQLQPGTAVLQQLWRKTPAGFNTSLNPHQISSSVGAGPGGWSAQALVNCLWGCARVGAQPTRVWLQGFEAASVSLLPSLSTQLLSNTLWAFGQIGYRPSEAWLNQYWMQTDRLVQQLQQATAAAAGMETQADASESFSQAEPEQRQQQRVEAAAAEVVMVLQAAGKVCILPPKPWLQQAVAAVKAAAVGSVHDLQQEQQQHSGLQLKTLTGFVHTLGRLAHTAKLSSTSSSSGAASAVAVTDVEDILQHALGGALSVGSGANNTSSNDAAGSMPVHLSSMDVLMLLSALPLLPLSSKAAATNAAVLLLARCWQLLSSSSGSSSWSSKQLVEVAVSAAQVVQRCCGRGSSSSSSSLDAARTHQLWHAVWQLMLQQPAPGAAANSFSSSGSSSFVRDLCSQFERHVDQLPAADVSRYLAALSLLHSSSSRSAVIFHNSTNNTSSSSITSRHLSSISGVNSSAALSPFVMTAGEAVGRHMAAMTAHQRAVAAASLAQLHYCPTAAWLESLLLHSSCQLSSSTCSSRDLVLSLQGVSLLLRNYQRRHLAAAGESAAAAVTGQMHLPADAVVGWLRDWLGESARRMGSFTPAEMVTVAVAMHRQLAYLQPLAQQKQQQQGAVVRADVMRMPHVQLMLPAAWRGAYLSAVLQHLRSLTASELVTVLTSVHKLQLRPSHQWCAAVAAEAAARAASALQQQQQGAECSTDGSSSVSISISGGLQVHHVGLLAYAFNKLGFKPAWAQRQLLLQHVLYKCRNSSSSSVNPKQLMEFMLLLSLSGWYPSNKWVRYFKRSKPVRQLRLYLSKKRHRGSWRMLERRLKSWEQLQLQKRHSRSAV